MIIRHGDLTEKEIKVLEYIRITGLTSSLDIQKHFDMEQKPVSRIITKLKEKNYIVSEGLARKTVYKVNESRQESGQTV